jgi:S-adenosylmethionine decarboxylase proenzyme
VRGLHLTGDLYRCSCDSRYLTSLADLRAQCVAFCRDAGLEVVGDTFYQFEGAGGITGTVLLAESHIAIHTWPESRSVTLDVYVCNYSQENSRRAENLFENVVGLLEPEEKITNRLQRGKP